MKRYLPILLTMMLLILSFTPAFAESVESVTVVEKHIENKTNTLNTNLKIPQIEGMKNIMLQTKLNSEFMRTIMQFKNNIEIQAQGAQRLPYEAVATYFVSYNKNGILSVTVELYSYTGGAHGMTERISYNTDLNTGKNLLLKDLFKKGYDYQTAINKEIKKQIAAAPEGTFFKDEFKTIKSGQPYYLKDDGIVIYFGLYDIAPYAYGFPEFFIPYEMLADGLSILKPAT